MGGSSLNKHDKVVDSPAAEDMKDSPIAGCTPSKPTAIVKPNSEMSKEEVSENKSDDVIETLDGKPKKKVLPPKPWLKNKKKSEVNEEEKAEAETNTEIIDNQDEKPKKKALPPKPWLKKKRKIPSKATNDDEEPPIPAPTGYNLDFLDKLDDPNFDPFATKSSVVNDGEKLPEPPKPKANLDFLDKMDDPNFNTFENKAKVVNDVEELPEPPKPDFLEKLDDPNFNPFETKAKIVNDS